MVPMNLLKPKKPSSGSDGIVRTNTNPHQTLSSTLPAKPRQAHPWRRVIIVAVIALVAGVGIFVGKLYWTGSQVLDPSGNVSLFSQIKGLIATPDKPIRGEEEGRINVLLLGFGGKGHDGAYLTDTIMVASFKPDTKDVAFISLPRDLFVDIPGYGYRKINNAYAFGHAEDETAGGEQLAQAVVQETLGISIHYYAWVDFTGFKRIVDDIGGVPVQVETAFTDYSYPTEDYGYQTISFKEGEQVFDGETALKYVRSRKGTNGEGSDFARSRRQQSVIFSIKEKLIGFGTLANPTRVNAVLNDLANHMQTNFQAWELMHLAKLFNGVTQDKIVTKVLDNSTNGLLMTDYTADGAYILRPKSGDFDDIHYLAQNIFDVNAIEQEAAELAVFNATAQTGYAKTVADDLTSALYDVTTIDTATTQTTTTIYDLSAGSKPETLAELQKRFGGTLKTQLPDSLASKFTSTTLPDIVIVLGIDSLPKNIVGGPVT